MRCPKLFWLSVLGVASIGALSGFQHKWREYPGTEYNDFPVPPDYQEKTEWVFGRLMYPNATINQRRWGYRGFARDWTQGGRGISWTTDYPRSDRHLSQAIRRLTRIHARSVEQSINLNDGDQYDWPWLYAVEVGHWELTDNQVKGLREFIDRGGFFMCDDFHGDFEWSVFVASFSKVFPDRQIVDIDSKDPIFHTVYDLDDKYQVPGAQYIRSGRVCERCESGGAVPHWRGIYDDKGRLIAVMTHNMDLGDSWEHADNPEYDERFSALGIRIGVNYIIYAMTH
jgi:hypothetical protein